MNDAEFLDHCERLCKRPDALGNIKFPAEDHQRFSELAGRLGLGYVEHCVLARTRLETIQIVRRTSAEKMRKRLTK